MPQNTDHLIFANANEPFKFSYKWLSHLGLDRPTYADQRGRNLTSEYRLLRTAVVIRAKTKGDHDEWNLLEARVKSKSALKPGMIKPFKVFAEYHYAPKQPQSLAQHLDEVELPDKRGFDVPCDLITFGDEPPATGKIEKFGEAANTNLLDDEPPQHLDSFGLLQEHCFTRFVSSSNRPKTSFYPMSLL